MGLNLSQFYPQNILKLVLGSSHLTLLLSLFYFCLSPISTFGRFQSRATSEPHISVCSLVPLTFHNLNQGSVMLSIDRGAYFRPSCKYEDKNNVIILIWYFRIKGYLRHMLRRMPAWQPSA